VADDDTLGARLRQVREQAGWSLRDLEKRSGLKSGYLSQLEQAKITHPSPSILRRVAEAYQLRFQDVLVWAGYASEEAVIPPNQAVALSTVTALGDPSNEELDTLKAIVEVLQRNRRASFSLPSDLPLDEVTREEIRRHALALLREADALGVRPTPLEQIVEAAKLVESGELTLDVRDRKKLTERFGHWVDQAWSRLQGTFDFRSDAIWVKPDLHPMKQRFVLSHEIGHAILPAHKETFAYVDDYSTLPPFARDLYEREANQAAVEILFQAGQLTDEIDSSPITLPRICDQSVSFGGSIVASARYAAETSRRIFAIAIAHYGDHRLGPTHIYCSKSFEANFGWQSGNQAPPELRAALKSARLETDEMWVINDRRREPRVANVEKMSTGFAAVVLVVPESKTRSAIRRVVPVTKAAAGLKI
jgi:HTH-type transcriptional regulator, competence development regulator